jgi:hypothetical protein
MDRKLLRRRPPSHHHIKVNNPSFCSLPSKIFVNADRTKTEHPEEWSRWDCLMIRTRVAAPLIAGAFRRHRNALGNARAEQHQGFSFTRPSPCVASPQGQTFLRRIVSLFVKSTQSRMGISVFIGCVPRATLSWYASPERLYTGASGSTPNCALFSMTIVTSSAVMHCVELANP